MTATRILAALVGYLESHDATAEQIGRYIRYWRSSPRDPSVPRPICYTFRGGDSGLSALHEKDGYMPLVCTNCNETFNMAAQ
jgi:hypothetical protein